MSLFDTIIGRENLQALPPEMQDQARSAARREFILNSLLGGRGLASGFEAARGVVPAMQAQQRQRQIGQAIDRSMVPMGTGLTQFTPGSQGSLLAQENAAFGDDPVVQQRTLQALQRNPNLPRQIDPSLYLQNILPLMASDPSKALPIIEAARPRIDSTLGIQTDASGRITGTFEREGRTPGTGIRMGQSGELTTRALPGAAQAAEMARPIDLSPGEVIIGYDLQGLPIVQNAQGVIQSRLQRETATALGQAAGQVERVYDTDTQTERLVPRTAIVGGIGAGGGAGGGQGAGGFATGPSPDVEAVQRTRGTIFESRVKNIAEKASDAGRRSFQANQLYDTASRLDPTALTAFGAAIVPYIRAIPGLRDTTDQFATDTALFGQQYARGVLGNFANVKGNLNAQEVRLVEDANWQRWDPRTATRYVAALEAAFADKDAAQLEFANRFMDDPENKISEFDQAWQRSENNINVFNHPMMQRFVNDEVSEALSRGVEPNLPPGFTFGRSRSTGQPQVRTPDGSILAITQ